LPLVFAFHGYGDGDNGPLLETFFKFKPVANEAGFLYITPDGTKDTAGQQFWNATDACCDFDALHPDDVGYIRAVVQDTSKHYRVDAKRVYAFGLSAGGFFVHRLACDAADVFAAVFSMSGATFTDASQCKPTEPLSIVELHGTKDTTVSYDGGKGEYGGTYPAAKDTIGHWAGYDGCTGDLTPSGQTYDLFPALGGAETQVAKYASCTHGDAELWTVTDGSHAPAIGPAFAQTVWSFFAAHPKP
jgi:polyhydroxybutyrate depolymerase